MTQDEQNRSERFTAAILIASDRVAGGMRSDITGPMLKSYLEKTGFCVEFYAVVADDRMEIAGALRKWVFENHVNLILTSGGTGLSPRDLTPEATLDIIERRVPGMEEAMRQVSLTVTPHAMISRAVAGTAAQSLIINLPGSPTGAIENFKVVEPAIRHGIELILGRKPDP